MSDDPAYVLPTADNRQRQWFVDWLHQFAGYVREVDYQSARPLFHEQVLAFGTHTDVIPGLQAWIDTQWDNVWPHTTDFRFIDEQIHVLVSEDETMAVVIAPWNSTGYSTPEGEASIGQPFDRPGRATMVFHRCKGSWLCVHSHMSLNRGVPQSSHANRPVKVR